MTENNLSQFQVKAFGLFSDQATTKLINEATSYSDRYIFEKRDIRLKTKWFYGLLLRIC